jgi:hypothetical protein
VSYKYVIEGNMVEIEVTGKRRRRPISYWMTLRKREDSGNWKRKQ